MSANLNGKQMTYKNLMRKLDDGRVEIEGWAGHYADVRFFDSKGNEQRREYVEVTNIPAEIK